MKSAPANVGICLAGVVRTVSNEEPVTLPMDEVGSRLSWSQAKVELVLVKVPPLLTLMRLRLLTPPFVEKMALLAVSVPPDATVMALSGEKPARWATKLAGLSTESVPLTLTVAPMATDTFDPARKFSLFVVRP